MLPMIQMALLVKHLQVSILYLYYYFQFSIRETATDSAVSDKGRVHFSSTGAGLSYATYFHQLGVGGAVTSPGIDLRRHHRFLLLLTLFSHEKSMCQVAHWCKEDRRHGKHLDPTHSFKASSNKQGLDQSTSTPNQHTDV